MKPGLRYGLIALFFLAFLLLAPLVVAFVTGIKYDPAQHAFVRTGSISVKTQPKRADIFLNGEKAATSPATIRFLKPGDYSIRLHKDGYFDWTKILNVRAQYVSYANQDLDNVTLFLEHSANQEIKTGVANFYAGKKRILYLADAALFLADADNPQNAQQLSLPKAADPGTLQILASNDENYYLFYNSSFAAVFDARSNKIYDISAMVDALGGSSNKSGDSGGFKFSDNDQLYFLAKPALYLLDWQKETQKLILPNVSEYAPASRNIYFLSPDSASGQTRLLTLSGGNTDLLLANLPAWTSARIFLNSRNQIYILGDGVFYAVGANSLQRIADAVADVQIINQYGEILLSNRNELDLYNFFSGKLSSITRSSKPIGSPALLGNLGWALFINDSRLQALELDNRDHQNDYTLAGVSASAKFYPGPNLQKLFLLDSGKLQQLTIR